MQEKLILLPVAERNMTNLPKVNGVICSITRGFCLTCPGGSRGLAWESEKSLIAAHPEAACWILGMRRCGHAAPAPCSDALRAWIHARSTPPTINACLGFPCRWPCFPYV